MSFRSTPQVVNDVYLVMGNDLVLSPSGDLLLCNGSTRTSQRIVRRLLTNPADYIWHSDYGAGLPEDIGLPISSDNFDNIRQTITAQIFLEQSVVQTPQPQIFLSTIQFGLFCQINYNLNPSLEPVVLTFNINAGAS
ncbi:MAG: phage tail protein [Patescibacteria group bacterium]|nr:phage tail protein [Patescibacteria group bacterium]